MYDRSIPAISEICSPYVERGISRPCIDYTGRVIKQDIKAAFSLHALTDRHKRCIQAVSCFLFYCLLEPFFRLLQRLGLADVQQLEVFSQVRVDLRLRANR